MSLVTREIIRPRNHEAPKLSYQMQQLWFLSQLSPDDCSYNCGYAMRLNGPLDVAAFDRALNTVLERHEILRTRIVTVEGEPIYELARDWSGILKQIDLRHLSPETRFAEANRIIKDIGSRPFDFSRDLPLRALLVRFAPEEHLFAYFPHHIVWELRSTDILFTELSAAYGKLLEGKQPDLPPLPVQYADYASWQHEYLSGTTLEKLQGYWKRQLARAPKQANLPVDYPYPAIQNNRGARYPVTLPADLKEAVDQFSRQNGSSPFRVLGAAFHLLISCYTGQSQISVGTPVAPPLPSEIRPLIGLFACTVVIRSQIEDSLTFRGLTKQIGSTVIGAIRRAIPFDMIVKAVQPPRDTSRMLLFQVNIRVLKSTLKPLKLPGMQISAPEWVDTETSKFDLSMELIADGGPGGFVEYRTDLFDESTIGRLIDDFYSLLAGIITQPDCPIGDVTVVRTLRRQFCQFKPVPPRMIHRGKGVEVDTFLD